MAALSHAAIALSGGAPKPLPAREARAPRKSRCRYGTPARLRATVAHARKGNSTPRGETMSCTCCLRRRGRLAPVVISGRGAEVLPAPD
jgi:hypothetical protein